MRTFLRAGLAALVLAALPALAQEGRAFNPIARPAARLAAPDGAVRVTPPVSVPRERVEAAVAAIATAWSEKRLETVLAPGFQRRAELADAMQVKVPRGASLRVTAIQGWQVLDQWRGGGTLVSRVSVTVRSQVEFSDAAGYQARHGTNEWVMTIRMREGGP